MSIKKTIRKMFTFDLTEEEKCERGRQAGQLSSEKLAMESEFDDVKKDFKSRIGDKELALKKLLRVLKDGKEDRTVECTLEYDFDAGVARYWYAGSIKEERPLTTDERQMTIEDGDESPREELRVVDGGKKPDDLSVPDGKTAATGERKNDGQYEPEPEAEGVPAEELPPDDGPRSA